MRARIVATACWLIAAGCRQVDPPRAPGPVAPPAAPTTIAKATVTPPPPPLREDELQAALARDLRDASAYEGLARLYFERSLDQRSYAILARQVIAQGLAVLARDGRTSADLLATRGLITLSEGRVDRALEDLAAAVAIDPAHPRALAALGAAALTLRDFSRAQAAFAAIVATPAGAHDFAAWFHLGASEQGLEHFDAAERAYRRAAEVAPADPRPHYALAQLFTRRAARSDTERDEEATHASFRRARDLAGDDPRFAELRALAEEGIAGRRFLVCHYPVGTFYGTEAEYEVWKRGLDGRSRLQRLEALAAEDAAREHMLRAEEAALQAAAEAERARRARPDAGADATTPPR